jgi:hypothetical protein
MTSAAGSHVTTSSSASSAQLHRAPKRLRASTGALGDCPLEPHPRPPGCTCCHGPGISSTAAAPAACGRDFPRLLRLLLLLRLLRLLHLFRLLRLLLRLRQLQHLDGIVDLLLESILVDAKVRSVSGDSSNSITVIFPAWAVFLRAISG